MQERTNTLAERKLQSTRPEVLTAALLYLLNAYRRNRCPSLAACIARHFYDLARHPRADRVLCDIAAASIAEWKAAAREPQEKLATTKPRLFDLPLH